MTHTVPPTEDAPTRQPRYPSDMNDAEWRLITPFVAPSDGLGAPRDLETRAVVDALRSRLRTGCQWRQLPRDFPKWYSVYYYWQQWSADGAWERINSALRAQFRQADGRAAEPSAAIIDSQTVKTTEVYDETSMHWVYFASIHVMQRRLARRKPIASMSPG